jgi:hypothetical protein
MRRRSLLRLIGMAVILLTIAGCELQDANKDFDKYYDFIISGALVKSGRGGDLVEVHLNPLVDRHGDAVSSLDPSQVTLTEDRDERDVTTNLVSNDFPSAADFVFLIDMTGSMAPELSGVEQSVIQFVNYLVDRGFDVMLGGIAFADRESEQKRFDLSADADAFKDWVGSITATGGGMEAENGLNAVMDAYGDFTWRRNAQKIFVMITDAPQHQPGDEFKFEHDDTSNTMDSVCRALARRAAVNVISADLTTMSKGETNPRYLAACTGGLWLELPENGEVNLGTEIADAISKSWVLSFSSSDPNATHTVELTIQLDKKTKGQTTWEDITYEMPVGSTPE